MKKEQKSSNIYIILSTVLYGICALISIYTTQLLGNLIDAASAGNIGHLVRYIIICVISLLAYILLVKIAIYFRMTYVKKRVLIMRQGLFAGILSMKMKEFQKKEHAEYINLLLGDMEKVESDYYRSIPIVVFSILQFAAAIIMLFFINPWLLLAYFIFFLVPIFVPQLLTKKLETYQQESSQANEKFLSVVNEIIYGFETIKLNGGRERFYKKAEDANEIQQEKNRKTMDLKVFLTELSNITGSFSQLACIAFGGYLIIKGKMSVGDLIVAMQLINYCFQSVQLIGEKCSCLSSVQAIKGKILDFSIERKEEKEKLKFSEKNGELEYKEVTFGFEQKRIAEQVNQIFKAGGIYAIVGGSGKGKTTFAKLALKYYDINIGKILLNGQDIYDIADETLYQKIKYVSQSPYLFNDTLWNNITMMEEYPKDKVEEVIKYTNLTQLIQEYGDSLTGDFGDKISGGEKQRISLARALLTNPQIIIFDEPTSSLDPINKKRIEELIFGIKDITRIVITHNWDESYLEKFDKVIKL